MSETQDEHAVYYCPGCGKRYETAGVCNGPSAESPHEAIELEDVATLATDDPTA